MKKNCALIFCVIVVFFFASCSMQKQIAKQADRTMLSNPDFAPAHVGISLYDPATKKYLYNHDGEKFFVPASNTKLFTCYAAMRTLGDSLIGLRYSEMSDGVAIEPTADPTFLLPEFTNQPAYDFLKKQTRISYYADYYRNQFSPFGRGWAWDDYGADYMPERSEFPIHGNYVTFKLKGDTIQALPGFFARKEFWPGGKGLSATRYSTFAIERKQSENFFYVRATGRKFSETSIPFQINAKEREPIFIRFLQDTLGMEFGRMTFSDKRLHLTQVIHSQPTDTMLKLMMHRSDNFFAEQTLLMVSNERLGYMSDTKIIDTLLKSDFAALPQQPKWVDGSGLSRYNLFSPQDFVWVLTQMKNEFKWERIANILPTGGEGTLASYYKNYKGRIFAKTGSLSNHLALSGYLITRKGKQLIFSVLVNAHNTAAANIRKGVEKFLVGIMEMY